MPRSKRHSNRERILIDLKGESNSHRANVAFAKGLCKDMEERDKEQNKVYKIPIPKGFKIVTKEKFDEYVSQNN